MQTEEKNNEAKRSKQRKVKLSRKVFAWHGRKVGPSPGTTGTPRTSGTPKDPPGPLGPPGRSGMPATLDAHDPLKNLNPFRTAYIYKINSKISAKESSFT